MCHAVLHRVALFVIALGAGLSPSGAQAQVGAPVDLTALTSRPLAEMVAELPGRGMALAELLPVALDRSLPIAAARVRRRLSEAGVEIESGDFDPALELEAGLAKSRQFGGRSDAYRVGLGQVLPWGTAVGVELLGGRAPSTLGGAYDADVGVTLSQPLLEGFGTRNTGLRVARFGDQASVQRLTRATTLVVASVELAYGDLAEAEAIEAVLQRSWEISQALLFRNEQLAERQLVAEVDVITARSAVALRRSTLVTARRDRGNASDALAFLVWGEDAVRVLARDTLLLKTVPLEVQLPVAPGFAEAEATALSRRADVLAKQLDLRGAEVSADDANNARLPSLSLDGGLRSGGTDLSFGSSLGSLDQGWSWSLGLAFSQPLGNRRDRGRDQTAEWLRELRRLEVVLTENSVGREVREAVRGIRAGMERVEAAEEAAALASAQLEAERGRLDLGLGDSFRLLETDENAVQAELEYVRARYDLARAGTLYRLASGEVPGA